MLTTLDVNVQIVTTAQMCLDDVLHSIRTHTVTWINERGNDMRHTECQNVFFLAKAAALRDVFVSVTIDR